MSWSILVVDDEPMTRQLLKLMLKSSDFSVSEAKDGQDALDSIAEHIPDLIILDVMMPGVDGLTVCRTLRGQSEMVDLPVIMLSAKTHPDAVQEGLEAGATRYMFKPTSRKDLLAAIEELLPTAEELL